MATLQAVLLVVGHDLHAVILPHANACSRFTCSLLWREVPLAKGPHLGCPEGVDVDAHEEQVLHVHLQQRYHARWSSCAWLDMAFSWDFGVGMEKRPSLDTTTRSTSS